MIWKLFSLPEEQPPIIIFWYNFIHKSKIFYDVYNDQICLTNIFFNIYE